MSSRTSTGTQETTRTSPGRLRVSLQHAQGEEPADLMEPSSIPQRTRRRSATISATTPKRAEASRSNSSTDIHRKSHADLSTAVTDKRDRDVDEAKQPFTAKYARSSSGKPTTIVNSLRNIRDYHIDSNADTMAIQRSDQQWKADCDVVVDHLNKYRELYKRLEARKKQLRKARESSIEISDMGSAGTGEAAAVVETGL